ncbi:cell division protein FtsK [Oxalobacter formigenes]
MENERKELLNMTVETIGKDILGALVQEIKLMPDVWPKLSESKQNDVIERLRNRVETNVKMAVHLIASDGRTVVTGDVESITIKDGIKAVLKFPKSTPNLPDLCLSEGGPVLVVLAGDSEHTHGMDEVRGESDQRAMNLGDEYKPDSDGDGMDDEGVIDGGITALLEPPEQEAA